MTKKYMILLLWILLSPYSLFSQTIFDDAESNLGFYSYNTPGSGMTAIANSQSNGINTSSTVRQYTRPGSTDGGFCSIQLGFNAGFTATLDLSVNSQVKIKIFAPKMVKILGILGISGNAAANVVRSNEVTMANQWQELSFDFSAVAANTTYNRLIFQFDPGTNNTGTYLLDDIKIDNIIVAPHITTSANGGVYNLNLSAVDVADNNNASDLKVSFNKVAPETYINAYRAIVVKDASANNFTIANANALSSASYTEVSGSAYNYMFNLPSGQLDSDGDPINNSTTSYRVFILSIAKAPATINKLSSPSNVILNCGGTAKTYIFDDAECQRNITYNYLSGSGYLPAIANPVSGGINTSSTVLSYKRPGSADGNYSNIQATFSADQTLKLDLSERNIVKLKVYSPTAGIVINCQLNTNAIQQTATITAANTWQELSFDFSAQSTNTTINKIILLVAPNTTNTGQYYFDDFKIISANKKISAFSFQGLSPAITGTINETNKTISLSVPTTANITSLVSTFTTSLGSTVSVSSTTQVSGTTANDFTNPVVYTVTAEDGSTVNYTVTVNVVLSSSKVLSAFSFASPAATATINETNKTVSVSVPFGTDVSSLVANYTTSSLSSVSVGSTNQQSGVTANNFTSPVVYTVTAEDGTTANYTVTVTVLPSSAKVLSAFSFVTPAVSAMINETNKTVDLTVPFGTNLTALVANFTLSAGASAKVGSTNQVSGTTTNNFTNAVVYIVTAEDASTVNYTVTVTTELNTEKKVTAYSFSSPSASATINESNKTIDLSVPLSTDVTALVANFTISAAASASVGATAQQSGVTANDFTSPVVYTITAENGTTVDYTVTVTKVASTAKSITAYSFSNPAVTGTINETNKTIALAVPFGTDVTALVASFTVSAGASVEVGSTNQVSGTTANDFTSAVTYVVTAEDASTASYTVTVTVNPVSGIMPTDLSSMVKVFPSVSEGIFNIDIENNLSGDIIVFNNLGKVVYKSEIKKQSLDLQSQPNGTYFVRINTENGYSSFKIIKF